MKHAELLFLFDVDGVIGETPHEEAWKAAAVKWRIIPEDYDFTDFYARKVAGEPGRTGAANILGKLKPDGGPSHFEKSGLSDEDGQLRATLEFRQVKQEFLDEAIAASKFRVFDDVGRLVVEARHRQIPLCAVSASENAGKILEQIDLEGFCDRVGVEYPLDRRAATFLDVFHTTALGAISYWPGAIHENRNVEKISHYAMAYGVALESARLTRTFEGLPYAVVFEDAPKGIEAVTRLGFVSVGISRRSTSGADLASKESLTEKGANLAYNEEELRTLTIEELLRAVRAVIPKD
jgi:beta-phosphoglucomutase-like phosphatase (HAD superfamily)